MNTNKTTLAEERIAMIKEALTSYLIFRKERQDLENECKKLMEDMHSPATRSDYSRFLEIKREFNKIKNQLIKANEDENLAWENIPTQSKKEIKAIIDFGEVIPIREFQKCVKGGGFIEDDGCGYLHDGKTETDLSVWDYSIDWSNITKDFMTKYPFVLWYNK